jgi:hypothetical protein
MSGERVDMPTCHGLELRLGGETVRPAVTAVFDLMALFPPDWQRVDGLISLQTFDGRAVTFDFPNHRVVLETPRSLAERIDGAAPIELRLSRPAAGAALDVFFSAAANDGTRLWLLADSANDTHLVLAPHAAKALGVNLDEAGVDKKLDGSGRVVAWRVPKVEVNVSGLGALGAPALVRDLIYDGNLGLPVLRSYVLTVDLKNAKAWAKNP